MEDEYIEEDIEELKKKLKSYSREHIKFNEPHFTVQLYSREGSEEEVIKTLLNPDKLVYSYNEIDDDGNTVHNLHFKISNTRTMRLPVIFDKNGKKSLYIKTYIMSYRGWQNFIKKRRR